MKTFKEFLKSLNESPFESGLIIGASYDKEDVYLSYKENNIQFNIISEDVGYGKYILKEYNQTFYLADAITDDYLGNIQYSLDKDRMFIKTSHSKIKGMYGMVFTHIFKDLPIKYIFGDWQQSTQARKAWSRVLESFDGVVLDTNTNEITKYNRADDINYWGRDKTHLRIGITDDKALIEHVFRLIQERINEDFSGVYKKMADSKEVDLDMQLYPCKRMEL